MSEFKRWLDDPEQADSLEARVLSAGRNVPVPRGLEQQKLSEFMALLGPAPGISGAEGAGVAQAAGSTSASLGVGVLKSLTLGLALGTAGMTGVHALQSSAPKPSVSATVAIARPAQLGNTRARQPNAASTIEPKLAAPAPTAARATTPVVSNHRAPAVAPSPAPTPVVAPSEASTTPGDIALAPLPDPPSTTSSPPALPSAEPLQASLLQAEALELARAKNLLAEGRPEDARQALEQSAQRFANGALAAERELLRVQAEMRAGRAEVARERARRFLSKHPESSLARQIRSSAKLE
ncbi:MAG: hypothetical protein QM756_35170 [Polyangiaceae bacterium]